MYTYKPRTTAEIKADIAALKLEIERAHDDDRPDMEDDLASLYDELDDAEQVRHDRTDKYATTGLDLIRVIKALGGIPKDWDEGFLP